MVHNSRTLAGAFAFALACSMLIACAGKPEPTINGVGSTDGLLCGDSWAATGSMAEARYIATTTRLTCPSTAPDCSWKGLVLVAGGYGEFSALGSAERYDAVSGAWSAAGTLSTPRYFHRAVGLKDGRVLVTGGVADSGSSTASAEIYDPATNTWSNAASMSTDRYAHQLTLLADGRVLASGGYGGGLPALASAEIYDPQRNQWQPAGSMASPRSAAAAALLPDGKVLVAGGHNGADYVSSAEIFDPSTTSWRAAASMSVTRYTPSAAVLPNGRVLVTGGTEALPGAEIFNPATGTWSSTPDMAYIPRYFFETITLEDGRVMVIGGSGGAGILDGVEIFDPALGLWSSESAMTMSRYMTGAAQLLDGRILVAGGDGLNNYGVEGITNTAETYLPCPPNAPPIAVCANKIAYTGPNAVTCTAAAVSVDNGSYDPDNGPLPMTLWQDPAVGEPLSLVGASATLVASDGILQSVCQSTITVVDNTPPQLACPTTEIVECQWLGNSASQGQGSAIFEDAVSSADNCSTTTTSCTLSGQRLPLGDHTVTCTSTDQAQNTSSCSFTARVADTQPPAAPPSANMILWPADSTLVEVSLMQCAGGQAIDACYGRVNLRDHGIITHITSDEPEDAPGSLDGTTSNDMQIKKPWLALLRAERNRARNGRVYTVHYRVTDDPTDPNGRHTDSTCKVYVPVVAGTPVDQIGDDTASYCVQPQIPLAPPPPGTGCP